MILYLADPGPSLGLSLSLCPQKLMSVVRRRGTINLAWCAMQNLWDGGRMAVPDIQFYYLAAQLSYVVHWGDW